MINVLCWIVSILLIVAGISSLILLGTFIVYLYHKSTYEKLKLKKEKEINFRLCEKR